VQIVEPVADEFSLIIDSWASSFRSSPWAGCIPNHLYNGVTRAGISEILGRPGTVVKVAVADIENGRRVIGYSVSEPKQHTLHYLYVKRDYRNLGVGTAILEATAPLGEWRYTYRTLASQRFLGPRFVHNPVSARVQYGTSAANPTAVAD
jgi:GNAT superfamily N-acetyltransferase